MLNGEKSGFSLPYNHDDFKKNGSQIQENEISPP
jgi:hypothetical protein